MAHGKTIKIFLIDGEPDGRMTCELSNWTGKAYKIPRTKIKTCDDRPELNTTGVYILFGKATEDAIKDNIYIGEAEDILKRLHQHMKEKEFWHEAIAFISKDENLNKAHIKYLENRLYTLAEKAKRVHLMNAQIPKKSAISESDSAEMEEFLENVTILVKTLGYNAFEEIRKPEEKLNQDRQEDLFYINKKSGAEAVGKPVSEGFVVYEKSRVVHRKKGGSPNYITKLRQKLIAEGVLVKHDENVGGNSDTTEIFVMAEDYIFSSPSTAAALVMDMSANGLVEWKMRSGQTLKEFESGES